MKRWRRSPTFLFYRHCRAGGNRSLGWVWAVIFVLCSLPAQAGIFSKSQTIATTIHTQQGTVALTLEAATTHAQREKGLMHRRKISKYDGMVFIFPEPTAARFWMKNTLIPLDMLFIDETGRIVYIEHEAPPKNLAPRGKGDGIKTVIELDGGRARREAIAVGDTVRYALPESLEVR